MNRVLFDIDSFLGKSVSYWIDIDTVLMEHGITDADDLSYRLRISFQTGLCPRRRDQNFDEWNW